MEKRWFDAETGVLLLDEYVADMESFKKIDANRIVTDAEIAEHAQRVVSLLKELEEMLPPEAKDLAMEVLSEVSVLNLLYRKGLRPGVGLSESAIGTTLGRGVS